MSKIFKVLLVLIVGISAGNTMQSHTISDFQQMYDQNSDYFFDNDRINDEMSWFNCGDAQENDNVASFINLQFNTNFIDPSKPEITTIKTEHTPVNHWPSKQKSNCNNGVQNEFKLDATLLIKKRARDNKDISDSYNNIAIKNKMNKNNKSNSKNILENDEYDSISLTHDNQELLDIRNNNIISEDAIISLKKELLGSKDCSRGNKQKKKLKESNDEQSCNSIAPGIDQKDAREITKKIARSNIEPLTKILKGLPIDKQIDTFCEHNKYRKKQVTKIKAQINNFLNTNYLKRYDRGSYITAGFIRMICEIMRIENTNK